MIGLAAVTACAFVTVVAPNVPVEPASASFQGDFEQGVTAAQKLDVSGSVAATVFRDGYSVTEAPKPVIVETKVSTESKASTLRHRYR